MPTTVSTRWPMGSRYRSPFTWARTCNGQKPWRNPMLSKVRAVGAVVLAFSLACAGGEALDQEHGRGEPAPEPNEGASSARAAEGVPGAEEGAVLGGGDTPDITEGSNTNW